MAKWIISVLTAVIISYIVDLLLTNNKLQKAVRYVLSTLTLLIVVTPIHSLLSGNGFDTNLVFDYKITIDQEYLDFVMEQKLKILSNNAEKILESKGIANAKVKIIGDNKDGEITITVVEINLSESVIDENIQHINSNDLAKEIILDYLQVEESAVVCYG